MLISCFFKTVYISVHLCKSKGCLKLELSDMKRAFMDSTIRVVARNGLEKTSTKAIANDAGLNEAYIYKCFDGKEQLLAETMMDADEKHYMYLQDALSVMRIESLSWKERAFLFWENNWKQTLARKEDTLFYIRYYYSASCRKYAYKTHLARFDPMNYLMKAVFRPGTKVAMLMHQVFDTKLMFALRVFAGEIEDSKETTRWIFEQIYSFMAPHFNPDFLMKEDSRTAV